LAASIAVLLSACGPSGQVRVERHLECATDGTNCHTVETAQQEPSASDRFWQFLLLLALANGH